MPRRLLPLAGVCLLLSAAGLARAQSTPPGPTVRVGDRVYVGPAAGPQDRPVSVTVDAEPPAIHWEAAEAARGERGKGRFGMPRRARSEDLRAPGLSWPLSHPEGLLRWNLAWAAAPAGTVHETVEVVSDLPEAFLRLEGVRLVTKDGTVPPVRDGQVLRLRAEDVAARVERMVLRTRTTAEGPVLEVEAVDGVGNVGKVEWRLEWAG